MVLEKEPAPDWGPGFLVFLLFIPWICGGFQTSEKVQRVDSHVAGEEHVEPAEPEELAAVAGHGSLEESENQL